MSFLDGIMGGINPLQLAATAAFGPLGGIAEQFLEQAITSQLGQSLIQQLGQQAGLPQQVIDGAKDNFLSAFGGDAAAANQGGGSSQDVDDAISNYGQSVGASPQQIGDAQNQAQSLLDNLRNGSDYSYGDDSGASGSGKSSGGKGWLYAIAHALGEKANQSADQLSQDGHNLDMKDPGQTTDFQAESQGFNMLMSAITNAIKTLGDALGQMARKN